MIWTSPMLHFGHVNRIEYDLAQCFFEAGEEAPVNGKAAKDLASALKKIEAIVADFGTQIKVSIMADASVGPSWVCVTPSFHALCSEAFLRLGECNQFHKKKLTSFFFRITLSRQNQSNPQIKIL